MSDASPAITDDLSGLSRVEWLDRVEDIGIEEGDFVPLGRDHSAVFIERDPSVLLVTFEEVDTIRLSSEGGRPLGFAFSERRDWSHLCILAHGETWFRDERLIHYFDGLVDEGFFEGFDRVVFYGSEMGAYGAGAYSVAAPGATVLLVQPVATLDASRTSWDPRFRQFRRRDFGDRYGYGPEMVEAAGQSFVIFDPHERLDAMHAALFDRGPVTHLRCPYLGGQIEIDLISMGLLDRILDLAGDGQLDADAFFRLYRQRRNNARYLRRLLNALEAQNRPWLAALLCENAVKRLDRQRFRDGLRSARGQIVDKVTGFR